MMLFNIKIVDFYHGIVLFKNTNRVNIIKIIIAGIYRALLYTQDTTLYNLKQNNKQLNNSVNNGKTVKVGGSMDYLDGGR